MAEALKDKYLSIDFFKQLTTDLKDAYPALKHKTFYQDCVAPLAEMELKQRITHTTLTVGRHLPANYKEAIKILYAFSRDKTERLGYLFMPEFVARFGLQDFKTSMNALRDFTQYSSAEFAIREFLNKDFEKTFTVMLQWAEHENEHVRRLASEGSRPRLPWASQLPMVIKNPSLAWPVLELLKNDPAKYVQKSVANHINDISKDHPDWLLKKLNKWKQNNKNTDWIIKHGCRTLIKQANPGALQLFNVEKAAIKLTGFRLSKRDISLGESLAFYFDISSTINKSQELVIDYLIHYVKKNGQTQHKVFKLKSFELQAGITKHISKNHRFQPFTTRQHYSGKHHLEIMINGEIMASASFKLNV